MTGNATPRGPKEIGRSIRLVVADMDGTLLDSGKQVTRRTVRAVRALRECGIYFTVCSGRVYPMMQSYLRQLEIEGPVITCNGGVIVDTRTHRMVAGATIAPQAARRLIGYCKEQRLDGCLLTAGPSYFFADSARIRRFEQYNRIAGSRGLPPMELALFDEELRCIGRHEVHKVLICHPDASVIERARRFVGEMAEVSYTASEPGLLDIMAAGSGKGEGVRALARLLQIPVEQVCAFGDYDNDVPMLQVAGLPVAMQNGCDTAKAAALLIAPSNDEDGVARVLEEYLIKAHTD